MLIPSAFIHLHLESIKRITAKIIINGRLFTIVLRFNRAIARKAWLCLFGDLFMQISQMRAV